MRKVSRWSIAGLVAAFAVLLLAVSCGGGSDSETKKIRLGAFRGLLNGVPFTVATEEGIFTKHGLDVEFVTIDSSPVGIQAMAAGDLHMVWGGGTNAVDALIAGHDVLVVVNNTQAPQGSPNYVLVARADDSSINGPGDMRGKKIGLGARSLAGLVNVTTVALLKQHGIAESEVEMVPLTFPTVIPALLAGDVDVGMTISPFSDNAVADGQAKVVGYPYTTVGNIPTSTVIAMREWVNDNRDTALAFKAAMTEAIRTYNNASSQEQAAWDAQSVGAPAFDTTRLLARDIYTADFNVRAVQRYVDLTVELGYIDETVDLTDVVLEEE